MKFVWTQRARADLLAIGDYIAEDNPRAARRWVDKLRDRARKAAQGETNPTELLSTTACTQ